MARFLFDLSSSLPLAFNGIAYSPFNGFDVNLIQLLNPELSPWIVIYSVGELTWPLDACAKISA
eukprot:8867581-Prorocentrum_lima.AAC.1